MRLSNVARSEHRHALIAAVLLIAALVLGGGGSPNPSTEMLLEFVAGAAALAWLWAVKPLRLPPDRGLWILALVVIAVPVLQLVPLPPSIWSSLPGREAEVHALQLVDAANDWRPISISPPLTRASLISLIPPLFVMFMAGSLAPGERSRLIGIVAVIATISALFGAVQLAGGPSAIRLYEQSSRLVVTGFQANRNAAADVLLIGLVAVAAYYSEQVARARSTRSHRQVAPWLVILSVLLALACVMTASRAGILLLVPASLAALMIVSTDARKRWTRHLPKAVLAAFVFIGGLALLLQHNTALQTVANRFGLAEDNRSGLWRDTIYAIGQYFPFGSGMGTFVPTFIASEPLEAVDTSTPNRAHNDYLELALEAGVFGYIALAIAVSILALLAVRAWRDRSGDRTHVIFAVTSLGVIAAHSMVDYPLRSMSLACLAGLAAGLLARPPLAKSFIKDVS